MGVGEAARLLVAALEAANIPYNALSYDDTLSRQTHPFDGPRTSGTESDLNLMCINAAQMPAFVEKQGPAFFRERYSVGVWFWETEDFPVCLLPCFNYVDEIWVASEFMRQTMLKVSPKPVFKFHLPIIRPTITKALSRMDLDLPDRFIFLFSFDFFSVLERKNPLGLIAAFKKAFRLQEGPLLLIKTINGAERSRDLERVRLAAQDRPDILIRDGYLSPAEKSALMAESDCYVSLHRSEGFGLTMAEAMALGKPVIATGYSGNTEFMTSENSYLCSYGYGRVGEGAEPYSAESRWADPDLDEAALFMREVYAAPEKAKVRGLRAADDIRRYHSARIAGEAIRDRIRVIRSRCNQGGGEPSMEMWAEQLKNHGGEKAETGSP